MRTSLLLVLLSAVAVAQGAENTLRPVALADLFKPGPVFQDRNGDGVIDFIDARLALPDKPTAAEVAAAADIAARFGFETTAINLPISRSEGTPVFVGTRALTAAKITPESIGAAGLKAGAGAVVSMTVDAKPAIAIFGADDAGLAEAALMFAGHLPHLGDLKSPTIDKIGDDVRDFLAGKNISQTTVAVPAVFVKRGADAVERVLVDVQLTGGDFIKAQVALNQFTATAARDAKRALSYPSVQEIRVRLRTLNGGSTFVNIPRAVAPDPPSLPPARRPGSGAKDNFDLSTFYSNDGALGDSDHNLIPDRIYTVLSPDGDGTTV